MGSSALGPGEQDSQAGEILSLGHRVLDNEGQLRLGRLKTCTESWEQLGRPSRPRWSSCKGRWACSMVVMILAQRRLQAPAARLNLQLHGWANWRGCCRPWGGLALGACGGAQEELGRLRGWPWKLLLPLCLPGPGAGPRSGDWRGHAGWPECGGGSSGSAPPGPSLREALRGSFCWLLNGWLH